MSRVKPNGISRWMPRPHMYAVGCLNDGILAVDAERQGRWPRCRRPGCPPVPLETVACGWKGGLPPSSVESFSVTRLWKMPPLARRIVFSLS